MVQLSMLIDPAADTLESTVRALGERALARGVGLTAQRSAARACLRKFSSECGPGPLSAKQADRVRAYHRAVLRREVYRSGRAESAAYRERLRVLAAVQDLVNGGIAFRELRWELVGTLGMDRAVVDRVLGELAGAA